MLTLRTLRAHWEPPTVHIYRDDFTPQDHFIATVTTEDRTNLFYLLKGSWGDAAAPVLGNCEFIFNGSTTLYAGGEVRGGAYVSNNPGLLWMTKLIETSSQN